MLNHGNFCILSLIFIFGLSLCLTNGFADNGSAAGFEDSFVIPEDGFDFPTAEGEAYIQGNEEIGRAPNFIFGTPDFEKMRDFPTDSQDYQLGRKVAFIRTPVEPGSPRAFLCTGFLVGPDLLMTNHHCVHDAFGRPFPLELIQIYMDYYEEPNTDPTRGGVTAGVTRILRADARKDYALLRLDKPIGNTYGWLELDTTTRVNPIQESVKLISHNSGRSKEIVRRNSEIVEVPAGHPFNVPFAIAFLADTEGGSSGSPIFFRDGTGVIGINHSSWYNRITGEPTFNAGSLMSYIVPEIEQWLPDIDSPDLVIEFMQTPAGYLLPGESFEMSATVKNNGGVASPSTTLRFYQSVDSDITPSDIEVGTFFVQSLVPSGISERFDITLTTPVVLGTYYYGVCVDVVDGEERIDNNCLAGNALIISTTPPSHMYWTDPGANVIQRANLDGTNVEDLVTGFSFPRGLALDVEGGKMYWTDAAADVIQRANLDGSDIENLVTGLDAPLNGLALDVVGNKMYWTDRGAGKIQRANLDGSNVEDLVTGLGNPYGLALDVAGNKVYWTNGSVIQRANLDGSHIEDLVTGLSSPSGLALDVAGNKVYWTDIAADVIQCANLDGSHIEDLVTGLPEAPGLALDVAGNKMYWTKWVENKIQCASLDGSNVQDLVTGLDNPFAIALGILQTTPPEPTPPEPTPSVDVNGDGEVTVVDLAIVALFYGTEVPVGASLPADVNGDGFVDLLDLTLVAEAIDAAGGGANGLSLDDVEAALLAVAKQAAGVEDAAEAPMGFDTRQDILLGGIAYKNVAAALTDARFEKGIPAVLKQLLQLLTEMREIPETTALLPNYPNPFNPETWIPYHLATDVAVKLTIYDIQGRVVRVLDFGHQRAGIYQSRVRAAYWDGRNYFGESVASGFYFYTLTAGEFTATRKLLIVK